MDFPLPISLINWIVLAILIFIVGVTGLTFAPIVRFVRSRIKEGLFQHLRKWAYTYVAALAQDPTLKGLASEEKKQQAVIWLVIKAEELGIELSEREASQIVEEAVYLVKNVTLERLEDILEDAASPIIIPQG